VTVHVAVKRILYMQALRVIMSKANHVDRFSKILDFLGVTLGFGFRFESPFSRYILLSSADWSTM